MKKWSLSVFAALLVVTPSFAEIKVAVEEQLPPNLLRNPAFGNLQRPKWLPEHWSFDNCSRKGGFEYRFSPPGEALLKTSGYLFGYFLQIGIPVEGGKRYYVAADLKLTTTSLLWIRTEDYRDKLDSQNHPRSNTQFFASLLRPEQGVELVDELKDFVNPDWLLSFGPDIWCRSESEFTVPAGKNIKTYTYRIGSLGGAAGWIRVKSPVFREARRDLTVTIEGAKLQHMELFHGNGTLIRKYPLDPAKTLQKLTFALDSTIASYFIVITGDKNRKLRKNL